MPIRPAIATDIERLLTLVEALSLHHNDQPRLTRETLQRDVFGPVPWFRVLVADEDGVQGYAALLPLARLGLGQRGIDLHHLFVAESHRNRGIGTALIQASLALARDLACTYIIVGAHPANLAAQAYYQKLGFYPKGPSGIRFTLAVN